MKHYEVLLVDDEELALSGLLNGVRWKELGIRRVYTANNMEDALRKLSSFPVHLMICDIEMPGGSGLELIRSVRETHPDVISVFYTAHPDFSYCREALKLGAVDYLVKPTPYEEIEKVVVKALGIAAQNLHARELEGIWGNLSKKDQNGDPIGAVKAMIEENLSMEISRDELAAAVFLNPDYLTRRFKQETGMSISDYVIEKRLSLAKNLLRKTDMSIVEIAERSGFSYSSYFVRLFKKKTGITPQQYREQQAEEPDWNE